MKKGAGLKFLPAASTFKKQFLLFYSTTFPDLDNAKTRKSPPGVMISYNVVNYLATESTEDTEFLFLKPRISPVTRIFNNKS